MTLPEPSLTRPTLPRPSLLRPSLPTPAAAAAAAAAVRWQMMRMCAEWKATPRAALCTAQYRPSVCPFSQQLTPRCLKVSHAAQHRLSSVRYRPAVDQSEAFVWLVNTATAQASCVRTSDKRRWWVLSDPVCHALAVIIFLIGWDKIFEITLSLR